MAETTTTNYGWTMPDPGASANTWGATLNATTQKVDAQVFATQTAGAQGAVPVGAVTMFAGSAAPANWLLCNGQSLATTGTYAALFAILGYAFGGSGANFNLPDLQTRFPVGVGAGFALAATGGAATVTLDATMIPPHSHTATQAAHGHAATQAAHAHGIATGSHSHTLSTGTHSHSIPTQILTAAGGGNATAGAGWAFSSSVRTDTAGNLGGNTDTAGNLGGNTDTQAPAITVPTAQPAITVANTGGGAAHLNVPPYLAINFIIKFQ